MAKIGMRDNLGRFVKGLMKQWQLAEMFGVGQDVISRVVNGKAGYSNS